MNDLDGSFEVVGGEVIFQVTRKLDTGDTENDFLIPIDTDFEMAWAVKTDDSDLSRKHNKRD